MSEHLKSQQPQRISFNAEGREFQGLLLVPQNPKDTNVLFVRGGAVTFPAAQTFTDWQNSLGKAGYTSLFFDFPGSGGWTPGELSDNTLNQRFKWSEGALSFLQNQHPSNRVTIIGSSMGAPQAVALAAKYPGIVKGAIMSSGGMYTQEAVNKPFGPPLSEVLRKPQNFSKSLTVEQMRKLQIPFLIFYAEHDDVIPQEVIDLYRGTPKQVEFHILNGVGHKYLSPAGQAEKAARQFVYQTTNDFLNRIDQLR